MPKEEFQPRCYIAAALIFFLNLGLFISCENSTNNSQTIENPTKHTLVEFKNLEQFPVTIYSDPGRYNVFADVDANGSKKVAATSNPAGTAFYPTFRIDVPDIEGESIPYNGPSVITLIEENKTTLVPIPKLEAISINQTYLKLINNSNFSLSLKEGDFEKAPLGSRPNIIIPGQSAGYEINRDSSSGYVVMRNTTTPVDFPANCTEFEKGKVYTFTYNGTALVLTTTWPIPSPVWPDSPKKVQTEIISETSVKLTWEPFYGATAYRIYRNTSLVSTVTTPYYTITGLATGQNYVFSVKAVVNNNEGQGSAAQFSMPPNNVRITNRTNISITIGWNTVSGAAGYNIYRSSDENGPYIKLNENMVTGSSYVNNALSPETDYYYRIAVVIGNVQSLESLPVFTSTLSNVPDNVRVSAVNTGSVSLEWNMVNGASGYNVYRSDNEDGIYLMLNSVVLNNNEYTDTGLIAYTTYYYKVTSIFSGIESEKSNFATGSTGVIVSGNDLAAKLTWIKNNALSNYVYAIELSRDENLAPQNLSLSGKSDVTIIIRGITMYNINLSSDGSLFTIGTGVTLVVDNNVTLNGRTNNGSSSSLVRITNGGTLIMNEGAKITGNTVFSSYSASVYGGGVYVDGGTFLMNGGKITGNNASTSYSSSNRFAYGGGVYIDTGVFTMNAGEISGNNLYASSTSGNYSATAYGAGVYIANGIFNMNGGEILSNTATASGSSTYISGGGVYVTSGSVKFRMSGGVIYGSNAAGGLANSAANGAALHSAAAGTAQYGVVNDNTFYRSGDFNTSINSTIRIVDGNLLAE